MGCGSSKDSSRSNDEGTFEDQLRVLPGFQHLPTSGPLTAKQYKARLATSEGTQTVHFPHIGLTLRYAFVSQRGYYPGQPNKLNQDSLCVHTHFGGDPEQTFFGIYDGHGEYGTQCSQFAKDRVPENLLANSHFSVSPEIAFHRAMVLTNAQLHKLSDVDDSMSGTTAITLLVRKAQLYVANVGDSRAVLAERQGDRLVAQDLSFDQTPFRRDECDRVKRCGARVLTLDQLEGLKDPNVEYWGTEEENDGDPPRLWAPNATYPGTAFTRSIGDSAAERIGVFAEPEVLSRSLNSNHPFMVLASDGVWEFLPSQSVIDMVSKFDDPHEACLSVVAESYRLWLEHETRTDDITMLVVQFIGAQDQDQAMSLPTPTGALVDYSSRPGHWSMNNVRKLPPMAMAPIESMPSGLQTAMIMPALSRVLPQNVVDSAIAAALRQVVGDGMSSHGGNTNAPSTAPATPLSPLPPASVTGLSLDELNLLDRATQHSFLFSGLSKEERHAVYARMSKVPVQSGQLVIRQGDPGDHYYIVQSGLFDVYLQQSPNIPPELVHTYGSEHASLTSAALPGAQQPQPTCSSGGATLANGHLSSALAQQSHQEVPASFGEMALLHSRPRAATVVARTDGWLWSLNRTDFKAAIQSAAHASKDLGPIVKALRQVEVLQCLSGPQLAEMAASMTEERYAPGQVVFEQGQEGNTFHLIQSGQIVCMVWQECPTTSKSQAGNDASSAATEASNQVTSDVNTVLHPPPAASSPAASKQQHEQDSTQSTGVQGPGQQHEVLRLNAGQYFGERALLAPAKRAATVLAVGELVLLTITRDAFERVIGKNLQSVTAFEGVWRQQLALQREVLARTNTAALQTLKAGTFHLEDLEARGLLFATDCSALMLMEHRGSQDIFTVRVTSICDVVAAGKQALVMRARDITRGLEPGFFVPGVLHATKDDCVLAEVLSTVGLCTLDMLMAEGPLDELSAMFVAASVVLGLEHLAWSHVLFRGLSVHTLMVTEGGHVQLVDFRFARKADGRAYTLCGNPEYLAPEVVQQRGHSCEADLWSLGVLLHCLLTGDTPFAQPGDDELRIFRHICAPGPPPLSPALPPLAADLIVNLLRHNPKERLGAGPAGFAALKAHPWFAPVDWSALLEQRYQAPPGIKERVYNFEGVAYAHFEPQPFDGDTRWCDNF